MIWNNLPAVVTSSDLLFEFKNKIQNIGDMGDIDCAYLICRDTLWYSCNLLAIAIL